MLTVYKEQELNGYELNNPINYPGVFHEPASRLIEIVEHSVEAFSRPRGYHLRFRLSPDRTISEFTDLLTKAYSRPGRSRKRESTFKPLLLWTCENDPNYQYWGDDGLRHYGTGNHYHMALVLDGRKARDKSVHTLRTKFLAAGLVLDMAVIPVNDNGEDYAKPQSGKVAYSMDIDVQAGKEAYVYWMSYICKVRTKERLIGSSQRIWSSSKIGDKGRISRPNSY